jgi:hypothetical protein
MEINKLLEQFILFDKKNLLSEINELKKKLKITKEFKVPIIEMSSIYLRNLSFDGSIKDIREQIEKNKEKKIELFCTHNGKALFLKTFGKIESINKQKMEDIFKLLTLMRLIKKIDEVSYSSSQYYRVNNQFEELFEDKLL